MVKPQGNPPLGGIAPELISMGAVGLHPLFDSQWIRRAFDRIDQGLLRYEQLVAAHQAIGKLSRMRRVDSKRAYLSSLPESTVDTLVFLYFRTLDQFLESHEPTIH